MRVGVHKDVSYDDYAAWPAVRASLLNEPTLAHQRYAETAPREDTPALFFGTALHCALLEPAQFGQRYVVAPKCDKRTKAGKEQWAEFEAEHADALLLTDEEMVRIQGMRAAIMAEPCTARLIRDAIARELSFMWQDEETELACKGRADVLTRYVGGIAILDLKTTVCAEHHAFQRQMTSFGYYRSMAWYRWGLDVLAPAPRRCVLLAVEKSPPYCPVAYELSEDALALGLFEMRRRLRDYARAREHDYWPGYATDTVGLTVPRWKEERNAE